MMKIGVEGVSCVLLNTVVVVADIPRT